MKKEIKPWQEISRSCLAKTRVFDVLVKRMRSPDGSYEDDFYSLETYDWINVIPITSDLEVVLVRQFRHGTREALLEVPGGIIDEKHGGSPEQAAKMELREETGRKAGSLTELGWNHP
ncbi:MAG: NUDIX hydrolase, partial [Bdellovibrionales bacterium]|nr:NUDIX hydrolase [Bdellovibrionales bacterium]